MVTFSEVIHLSLLASIELACLSERPCASTRRQPRRRLPTCSPPPIRSIAGRLGLRHDRYDSYHHLPPVAGPLVAPANQSHPCSDARNAASRHLVFDPLHRASLLDTVGAYHSPRGQLPLR
ncbi:hypothetical protein CKAH01_04511 [Colletotrichum kahawae]|uniref:Secreted protein n=1 Tax=Colletotrichum kahawae TaxID=34407 RepID=A0AAD9YJU8_COLKA|nr:hypothetical protein CKAH01_04511 [Colletotrichum kahawae]